MIPHHTKNKGDIGVLKAKLDLFEKGYVVLNPETEHAPFDLAIWKDGKTQTVQVKYRELKANNTIEVRFRSSWADKNGSHNKEVNKDYIDLYCIYCPNTDSCYYLNPKKYNKSVTLRFDEAKNNQVKGVNTESDLLEI